MRLTWARAGCDRSRMSSDVAHYAGLKYWGPIGSARVESLLDLLRLRTSQRVLDIGCGRGELLLRLAERFGVSGVGVDRSAAAAALAQTAIGRRTPYGDLQISVCDASEFRGDVDAYDLVSWLGGPYLGEGFSSTLSRLCGWVRPGGYLLLGHGFWSSAPSPEYLRATGIGADEFVEHWRNIELGRNAGLTLLSTSVSSRDEWDDFEGRILCNWEHRLDDEHDEALEELVARKRQWNDAQQRWGRESLGFGLYLFRKPKPSGASAAIG